MSGEVVDAPGETWAGIQAALQNGGRGLPGGSSLARLLAQYRGRRNPKGLSNLSLAQIQSWIEAHVARNGGRRPSQASGPIAEAPGETWRAVVEALRGGTRGLPDGLSLLMLARPIMEVWNQSK